MSALAGTFINTRARIRQLFLPPLRLPLFLSRSLVPSLSFSSAFSFSLLPGPSFFIPLPVCPLFLSLRLYSSLFLFLFTLLPFFLFLFSLLSFFLFFFTLLSLFIFLFTISSFPSSLRFSLSLPLYYSLFLSLPLCSLSLFLLSLSFPLAFSSLLWFFLCLFVISSSLSFPFFPLYNTLFLFVFILSFFPSFPL